ncbi:MULTISPECIES: hypothetical protein [Achromobacter]|jgi:hypothetical protein|uniref:Uncharacterized protein n=1 Tax=Achromobacter denitrificans TaxID=32002 RepID=A0A6J5I0X4_ACHDE|nr:MULTISPECIES: hypothetical protein [Achromobacter]ASC67047.1 hypothetical protein B9P52_23440 [Achromobacter denitrificans]MDF3848750.1 hypothetical protein [Achromobacter denitrificans]MDF3861283.1 hypothetical protein [Achromobacter denitrificans]MDF3944059.1 hypothetical protein [Achromobacter denitrificans]QCS65305.1 hypothetical protein EC609_24260 [Achromobacter denitrificans]
MKKPAERDCLALVPGYSGQAAKLFLSRGADDRIDGVTVYDLLGHVKLQGGAEAAAAWVGEWLAQEAGNRKARRTQLLAQMFICKLVDDEKAAFLAAQKPLAAALAAAGVRIRSVAATSGAARQSLGPAVKKH